MKFLKNSKYKVGVVLLVTALFVCCMTSCYAEINGSTSTVGEIIKEILALLLNTVSTGVLGATIIPLINLFSLIIFLILYLLFIGTDMTNGLAFPFPDQIIFNKIPLLDPNFINPADGSIGKLASGALKNTYSSFFVLSVTIFTIAALVIGIKLVFSSLAAEKAKYKESLNNWIMGIVMLFLVHYLLAGMFYLNEQIVASVSTIADGITFPIDLTNILTGVGTLVGWTAGPLGGMIGTAIGKAASSLIGGLASAFDMKEIVTVDVPGYGGLILMFMMKGMIGGDLLSSIICLIILGQTFALVITYVKRAFMCILLGIMAPLVVAVDVIQKSLK